MEAEVLGGSSSKEEGAAWAPPSPRGSGGASSSGGPPPPPPPPPAADPRPRRAGRVRRGVAWGPFEVAPIMRGPVAVGYGGTCKKHNNDGDCPETVCKVHLEQGKRNPLTLDECRHRVKYWLYIGIGLANDAKDSRKRHLDFRPRHLELTMSEAELDALVMQ